jgi:DNA-binding IclR family transcriptional regulator
MTNAGARQKSRLSDVLSYLRSNPGASQAKIMRALGMTSKSHLQKCLDNARTSGLVRHRGGRGRASLGYEVTESTIVQVLVEGTIPVH